MTLERQKNVKWLGRPVLEGTGQIGELKQNVPNFTIVPFNVEGRGVNEYLNLIVREPLREDPGFLLASDRQDELRIPVATVSKQYELVQHHRIVEELENALAQVGLNPESLEATLTMTVYGERMWASFILPRNSLIDLELDNSTYVLRVNALNSVDKTTPLEINLTWYSLHWKTSLLVRRDARLKKIHLKSRKPKDIKEFLENQIRKASGDICQIREWNRQLLLISPRRGQIEFWIDEIVAKRWGVHAAARVYHIARTGYDGEIENRFESSVKPHERQVQSKVQVPGRFTPVRSACDIWRVLGWFASQRATIQDQHNRMMEIPDLMRALLKSDKPLTILIDEDPTLG